MSTTAKPTAKPTAKSTTAKSTTAKPTAKSKMNLRSKTVVPRLPSQYNHMDGSVDCPKCHNKLLVNGNGNSCSIYTCKQCFCHFCYHCRQLLTVNGACLRQCSGRPDSLTNRDKFRKKLKDTKNDPYKDEPWKWDGMQGKQYWNQKYDETMNQLLNGPYDVSGGAGELQQQTDSATLSDEVRDLTLSDGSELVLALRRIDIDMETDLAANVKPEKPIQGDIEVLELPGTPEDRKGHARRENPRRISQKEQFNILMQEYYNKVLKWDISNTRIRERAKQKKDAAKRKDETHKDTLLALAQKTKRTINRCIKYLATNEVKTLLAEKREYQRHDAFEHFAEARKQFMQSNTNSATPNTEGESKSSTNSATVNTEEESTSSNRYKATVFRF